MIELDVVAANMRQAYRDYLFQLVERIPQRRGSRWCWLRFHNGPYQVWRPRWLLGLVEVRRMPRQRPVRKIEVLRLWGWWDDGKELLVHCRRWDQVEGLMAGGMRGFQILGPGSEYVLA